MKSAFRYIVLLFALTLLAASQAPAERSPYLARVYEYRPAPGQFVNEMPEYEAGDTYADMLAKTEEQLCGAKTPGMVTLGAFGGYIIVGFDHPVVNVPGEYDFKLYGNSFAGTAEGLRGSSEPGVVFVSRDENGNGLPDDEWFELAGSEHQPGAELQRFAQVSYQKPDASREPTLPSEGDKTYDPDPNSPFIIDRSYIPYFMLGALEGIERKGYLQHVSFHTQPYWPRWVEDNFLRFYDLDLFPNNFSNLTIDGVANYSYTPFAWGYADNKPNDALNGFNIDWAIDRNGQHVDLQSIDFIRISTSQQQQCGWLGETSTEVSGGEDLHPQLADVELFEAPAESAAIFNLQGIKIRELSPEENHNLLYINDLPSGIYLLKTETGTIKFAK